MELRVPQFPEKKPLLPDSANYSSLPSLPRLTFGLRGPCLPSIILILERAPFAAEPTQKHMVPANLILLIYQASYAYRGVGHVHSELAFGGGTLKCPITDSLHEYLFQMGHRPQFVAFPFQSPEHRLLPGDTWL